MSSAAHCGSYHKFATFDLFPRIEEPLEVSSNPATFRSRAAFACTKTEERHSRIAAIRPWVLAP
jgi:hypothetical protein